MEEDESPFHVILFDGACGLCSRLCRFVAGRDGPGRFRFASLQGRPASRLLRPFGVDPTRLDTLYVLAGQGGPRPRLLARGRAVLFVLRELGGGWRLAAAFGLLPTSLLDAGYRLMARHRHRLPGPGSGCALPDPALQARLLDRVEDPGPGTRG